jgi:hypothetical protein
LQIRDKLKAPLCIELLQLATALIEHMPKELNLEGKESIK